MMTNGFKAIFERFDHQLRTEGYPTAELRRNGQHLFLAPGITVKQYVDTLRAVEKLEEVDGILRYRRPQVQLQQEVASIILDAYLNGESAQWPKVAARAVIKRMACQPKGEQGQDSEQDPSGDYDIDDFDAWMGPQ